MTINVQTASVGQILKKLLGLKKSPNQLSVLPAVLPVINQPYQEYIYFVTRHVTLGSSGNTAMLTVPSDEDWLLTSLNVQRTAGDGKISYFYSNPPAGSWFARADMVNYMSHYFQGAVDEFPFATTYGGVPIPPKTPLGFYYSHVSSATTFVITGTFLRRKW